MLPIDPGNERIFSLWQPGMRYAVWSLDEAAIVARMPKFDKYHVSNGSFKPGTLTVFIPSSGRTKDHVWLCFNQESGEDIGTRGVYVFETKDRADKTRREHKKNGWIKMAEPKKFKFETNNRRYQNEKDFERTR